MKRIDGVIVVGSPGSDMRYMEAVKMCVACWHSNPRKMMASKHMMFVPRYQAVREICYVCEGEEFCHPIR